MYRVAAQETGDPQGKATYQRLAGAERTHFNLVMSNYEHLVDTGRWAGLEA